MNNDRVRATVNFLAVFVAVPAAIGYVTGWLAGASRSPVTATVLPLVFGLLGIVGFGLVGRAFISADFLKRIMRPEIVERLSREIRDELEASATQLSWNPSVLAAGLVFSGFFFWGVQAGIGARVPPYPQISHYFKEPMLRPEEHAALFQLRQQCQAGGVPIEVYEELMNNAFLPVFQQYPSRDTSDRRRAFEAALEAAFGRGIPEAGAIPEADSTPTMGEADAGRSPGSRSKSTGARESAIVSMIMREVLRETAGAPADRPVHLIADDIKVIREKVSLIAEIYDLTEDDENGEQNAEQPA